MKAILGGHLCYYCSLELLRSFGVGSSAMVAEPSGVELRWRIEAKVCVGS